MPRRKLDTKLNFVQKDTFALMRIVFLDVHQTMTVQTQENVHLEFVMKSFVRKIQIALNHLGKHPDKIAVAYEDILWALINTKEMCRLMGTECKRLVSCACAAPRRTSMIF